MRQVRYSEEHAEAMHWPILIAMQPTPALPQVALDRPVCVVGARARVSLPLPSQHVSKAHALIVHEAQGVYLRDLVSRNKTFVNKRPVKECWLKNNDIVQFGTVAFQCRSGFGKALERTLAPAAELWLTSGGGASAQAIPLEQETFLIGNRTGCDLQLHAGDIASAHAILFVRDGRRFLRNLSPNGNTRVENQVIREVELLGEEHIQLGLAQFEFHLISSEAPVEDPSPAMSEDGQEQSSTLGGRSEAAESEELDLQFVDEANLPWSELAEADSEDAVVQSR